MFCFLRGGLSQGRNSRGGGEGLDLIDSNYFKSRGRCFINVSNNPTVFFFRPSSFGISSRSNSCFCSLCCLPFVSVCFKATKKNVQLFHLMLAKTEQNLNSGPRLLLKRTEHSPSLEFAPNRNLVIETSKSFFFFFFIYFLPLYAGSYRHIIIPTRLPASSYDSRNLMEEPFLNFMPLLARCSLQVEKRH